MRKPGASCIWALVAASTTDVFRLSELWETLRRIRVAPSSASREDPRPAPSMSRYGRCISCGVWGKMSLQTCSHGCRTASHIVMSIANPKLTKSSYDAEHDAGRRNDCIRVRACKPDWIERLRKKMG